MTELTTEADRDVRLRRIRFRAWHRGTRELDLLMGGFADAALDAMTEAELDAFEHLLDLPDPLVYAWLSGAEGVPQSENSPLFEKLRAFQPHEAPFKV